MGRPRINSEEDKKRKARARLQRWRAANPEKVAAQTARRREKYGDKERQVSREWYRKNPDVSRARVWPNNLKRFGMTTQDYLSLLEQQENRCAICRLERAEGSRRFAVDHSASTYEIRGLLCMACNLGIGWFKDDPRLLQAAIAYLGFPAKTNFKLTDPFDYYWITRTKKGRKKHDT